ncbi:MAG TPA: transcription termination/antitermination factor NusG [Acidimicrobiaceae bacterium]|nr:transcription termination/antitermination factor NusG [Acidimicrobiaceae bacterium]HCB36978.1 transcription termination/antitermination factor NusG [Acidimicrobiaceae bacterium]
MTDIADTTTETATATATAIDPDPMAAARRLLGDRSATTGLTRAPGEPRPEPAPAEDADADPADHAAGADPHADPDPDRVLDEDDLLDREPAEPVVSPFDRPGKWFVVHTQSGYEKKVKQNLEARMTALDMEDEIHEIEIPMEDVIEFKNGRKVVVKKKMFPGYLLIRCNPDDDVHFNIRNTPGITGYAGPSGRPTPLRRREVESFLQVPEPGEEPQRRTKPSVSYEIDESVRIKDGPFSDFQGQVIEINEEQLRVKVLVNIFGRETPVELEFAQVAKI